VAGTVIPAARDFRPRYFFFPHLSLFPILFFYFLLLPAARGGGGGNYHPPGRGAGTRRERSFRRPVDSRPRYFFPHLSLFPILFFYFLLLPAARGGGVAIPVRAISISFSLCIFFFFYSLLFPAARGGGGRCLLFVMGLSSVIFQLSAGGGWGDCAYHTANG
jgi:hypothetical protein